MNFRKRIPENNVGFQMAPMIDIIFLLLIFFIAASVYAQWESKIGIEIPTSKTGENHPRLPGEIIINVETDGRIFLNSVQYSPKRLTELLSQLAKLYPDQPVVIRADRATRYESIILVLDMCKSVDIGNVSFATLPLDTVVRRGGFMEETTPRR